MAAPLPNDQSYKDHPIARRLRIGGWLRLAAVAATIILAAVIAASLEA